MNGYYHDIQGFIEALDGCGTPYVILRNHENLHLSELFMAGHEDIDLLTADSRALATHIGAMSFSDKVKEVCNDGVHYYVMIGDRTVSLDIRCIGDGYYCAQWQRDMLERRVRENGVCVMDKQDYFYSLLYHCLLQKRSLSADAKARLKKMAAELNLTVDDDSIRGLVHLLEDYMKRHHYTYTYPTDIFVPLRKKYIDRSLLQNDSSLAFRHWKFDCKVSFVEFLVRIKHGLAF